MLTNFLRKCKNKRKVEKQHETAYPVRLCTPSSVFASVIFLQIVDTVLAKLFAQTEKTQDLYQLLQEPNHVVSGEIESVFRETGQYNALSILYRQAKNDEGLLDVWSK